MNVLAPKNQEKIYALIDAAGEPELFNLLETLNPPVACLFAEPLDDAMRKVAPYLIIADNEAINWLNKRQTFWGFYFASAASLRDLCVHLRHFLEVKLPEKEETFFFRFYDPRNMEAVCQSLTDWELHQFLGPIQTLWIPKNGELTEFNYQARRDAYPDEVMPTSRLLQFNETQMAQFAAIFEQRYIETLTRLMQKWSGYPEWDCSSFALDLFRYLNMLGICEDRLQRAIAKYCIENDYTDFSMIPETVREQLESVDYVPNITAKLFLVSALGRVPLLQELD